MKRTLSLILALAMIMSMVTTVAFAEGPAAGTKVTAVTYDDDCLVYYSNSEVTLYYWETAPTFDKNKLDIKYDGGDTDKDDYYWIDATDTLIYYKSDASYSIGVTAKPISLTVAKKTAPSTAVWSDHDKVYYYMASGGKNANADAFTVTAKAGNTALTVTAGINGSGFIGASAITGSGNFSGSLANCYTEYKLVNNAYYAPAEVEVPAPGSLMFKKKSNAKLDDKVEAILNEDAAFNADPTFTPARSYVSYADGAFVVADASSITSTTNKTVATLTDGTYTVYQPLSFKKVGGEIVIPMTNGESKTYAKGDENVKTSLAYVIANAVKGSGSLGAVTALSLDIPATNTTTSVFGLYIGTSTTTATEDYAYAFATEALKVKANAGYIGSLSVPYTATVGGKVYSGTLKFTSDYATTVTDKQTALFYSEEFYLDSISGISKLDDTPGATDPDDAVAKYYESVTVSPSGKTSSWTDDYTGFDKNGVAKKVTVTFTPVEYDILVYAEDGKSPFDMDMFAEFAEDVEAEQQPDRYDINAEYVEFTDVSDTKWSLKKGGKAIKTTDEFTASTLSSVYIDVTTAGYYDIPFRVYYEYKATKNDTWHSSSSTYYTGLIRVYAGEDGDIKYEVGYGDTVTFKSSDFAALYRKMAGSKKVLDTVTIDGLPVYGTLYRNAKVTNTYAVDENDVFYYDPTSANSSYDLDKLTYWASKSYTDEYSVYIPVTMYGTGGEEVAVVEIVITGGMPFSDIAKGSTFYSYIEYCYDNGIMGGKTETKFDAKSNITRAQLVTTLYRMAGSPATYNNKVLPFTDTTKLSSEFSNAVKWAYFNKIVGGTTPTTFAPNTAVTRQALVKILYGYATAYDLDYGVVIGNNLGYYTDGGSVSASMKEAMNWALDYSLLSGNGTVLNPKGSTTRGAAAKILANFHSSFVA